MQTETSPNSAAGFQPVPNSVRETLMAGLATDDELAAAIGCSARTIYRLNLPFVKIGARRFYDVRECRTALMSRQGGTCAAPRRPGRPRKAA